MTSVALSPKFQVVIPKDVRKALNLVAGQRLEARVVGDHVELVPELPISALRGMCRGISTDVPNDPEDGAHVSRPSSVAGARVKGRTKARTA